MSRHNGADIVLKKSDSHFHDCRFFAISPAPDTILPIVFGACLR